MSLATAHERALEIAERLQAMGPITVGRFFSGAGLRMEGIHFGFVIRGSLYLRVDEASRREFEALGAAPFSYAGKSQTVKAASYYEVPDEIADEPDDLLLWARRAYAAALAARSATKRKRPPSRQGAAAGKGST